jgi:hypothetical protein
LKQGNLSVLTNLLNKEEISEQGLTVLKSPNKLQVKVAVDSAGMSFHELSPQKSMLGKGRTRSFVNRTKERLGKEAFKAYLNKS